jgi:hypothetical protein
METQLGYSVKGDDGDTVHANKTRFEEITDEAKKESFKLGDKVICIYSDSRGPKESNLEGKLTAGKEYELLSNIDERNRVFIMGDHGKELTVFTKRLRKKIEEAASTPEPAVVGYSVPRDLFGTSVPKGTVYKKYSEMKYRNTYTTGEFVAVDSYELPAELVETWEPVYGNNSQGAAAGITIRIGEPSIDVEITWGTVKINGQFVDIEHLKHLYNNLINGYIPIGPWKLTYTEFVHRIFSISLVMEPVKISGEELKQVIDAYDSLNN